jgi:hypothetical protein
MEEERISTIEYTNIGCLAKMLIKPSRGLTIIEGRNATGKTTILNGLRSLKQSGHDPNLLTKGKEKGTIVVTLESGITITETITPWETTRKVRHPEMGIISRTREWIDSVINAVSFDPAGFLTAKPADRVQIFLEAMPKNLTAEQLSFVQPELLKEVNLNDHALTVIGSKTDGLIGMLYSSRTEMNREAKKKRATIAEMEGTLPPASSDDYKKELEELTQKLRDLQATTTRRVDEVEKSTTLLENDLDKGLEDFRETNFIRMNQKCNQLQAELAAAIKKLTDDCNAECRRLEDQFNLDMNIQRNRKDERMKVAREDERVWKAKIQAEYEPELARITEARSTAIANLEQHSRAQATRDLLKQMIEDADSLESRSDAKTAQIEGLEKLKTELLSEIPVKGVTVEQGQIFVDGIPYDSVNESRKYSIAVEALRVNMGRLGLQVLDRAEVFDSDSWAAFKAEIKRAKIPVIAARVADCDLTVTTEEAEGA